MALDVEQPPSWARPVPGAEVIGGGRTGVGRGRHSSHWCVYSRVSRASRDTNCGRPRRGGQCESRGRRQDHGWPHAARPGWDDRNKRSLTVLGGAVVFLLLIVCANVANLTLSRSFARARDRAVRTALGASRGDLVREALVEYSLLGAIGAVLGLGIAHLAVAATVGVLPETMTLSSLNAVDLDARALAFLAVVSTLTVLLFGVPPAILSSRATVADVLRRETRSATGSSAARRFRAALVVAEVALSLVLLVGAALMTRSLLKLQAIDIGLDTRNLITLRLGLPAPVYSSPVAREAFIAELLLRLQGDPDVTGASAGPLPPLEAQVALGALEFADRPGEKTKPTMLRVYDVWPRFFATAGIRIEDGRDFAAQEIAGATIVSHDFAAKYWPGQARGRHAVSRWRVRVAHRRWRRGGGARPRPGERLGRRRDLLSAGRSRRTLLSRAPVVSDRRGPDGRHSRAAARCRDRQALGYRPRRRLDGRRLGHATGGTSVRRPDRAAAHRAVDVVGVRRVRPGARRRRSLRRDVVPGVAAAARDRHPARARRHTAGDRKTHLRPRHRPGCDRRGDWTRRGCTGSFA